MPEHGYAELLKEYFDMEILSEVFGFNRTCGYNDKVNNDGSNEENVKMEFHTHFQMNLMIMQLLHVNIRKFSFTGCMMKSWS